MMNVKLLWAAAAWGLQLFFDSQAEKAKTKTEPTTDQATTSEESALRAQLLHDPRSLGANTWQVVQDRYNRSLEAVGRNDTVMAVRILRGRG